MRWRRLRKSGLGAFLSLLIQGCLPLPTPQVPLEERVNLEHTLQGLLHEAVIQLRAGNEESIERAAATFEVARGLDSNDPRVLDGLGCVEVRRGRFQAAAQFFKGALEVNPNYDRAYAHLAFLAEAEGAHAEAYSLLRQAVELNPLNFRARNNLAMRLADDGNFEAAYKELLRAAQSGAGPDDLVVGFNLNRITERR